MTNLTQARDEAKAKGEKYFFFGTCKNGHTSERYTSSMACVVCARAENRARRVGKLAKYAAMSKARRDADKEGNRKYMREYMIEYRKTQKGKENTRKACAKYAARQLEDQQKEQTNE